jgi:hypothetical protein
LTALANEPCLSGDLALEISTPDRVKLTSGPILDKFLHAPWESSVGKLFRGDFFGKVQANGPRMPSSTPQKCCCSHVAMFFSIPQAFPKQKKTQNHPHHWSFETLPPLVILQGPKPTFRLNWIKNIH